MSYIDGVVAAVPNANKQAFIDHARMSAEIFKRHGALGVVETWGDDVPDGKLTSFPMAVKCGADETVIFSWIVWPSKEVRTTGMQKIINDPEMQPDVDPMPFDGKRMIFGGFETIFEAGQKPKTRTCLWFDGQGEEAANFYVSLLPGSFIETVSRPNPDRPALVVEFTLAGAPYMTLNGGPQYQHSPAASISVLTKDQEETDRLWSALIADGGSEGQCAWLKDRYGVSWQIVPEALPRMIASDDKPAAQRAMAAMLKMSKIDIAALEAAFNDA
jgi:predicted 3-demethylubiquinone-9 3-methyltransferase (glyoxalase superfamily)/uncharacterized protein YbaA (DUF1428 family)